MKRGRVTHEETHQNSLCFSILKRFCPGTVQTCSYAYCIWNSNDNVVMVQPFMGARLAFMFGIANDSCEVADALPASFQACPCLCIQRLTTKQKESKQKRTWRLRTKTLTLFEHASSTSSKAWRRSGGRMPGGHQCDNYRTIAPRLTLWEMSPSLSWTKARDRVIFVLCRTFICLGSTPVTVTVKPRLLITSCHHTQNCLCSDRSEAQWPIGSASLQRVPKRIHRWWTLWKQSWRTLHRQLSHWNSRMCHHRRLARGIKQSNPPVVLNARKCQHCKVTRSMKYCQTTDLEDSLIYSSCQWTTFTCAVGHSCKYSILHYLCPFVLANAMT